MNEYYSFPQELDRSGFSCVDSQDHYVCTLRWFTGTLGLHFVLFHRNTTIAHCVDSRERYDCTLDVYRADPHWFTGTFDCTLHSQKHYKCMLCLFTGTLWLHTACVQNWPMLHCFTGTAAAAPDGLCSVDRLGQHSQNTEHGWDRPTCVDGSKRHLHHSGCG